MMTACAHRRPARDTPAPALRWPGAGRVLGSLAFFGSSLACPTIEAHEAEASVSGESPAHPAAPALYARLCAGCHGADLHGGLGSNLSDNQWRFGGDDDAIATSIRDGRAEAGMPPMRAALSDDEIRALVAFLREHNRPEAALAFVPAVRPAADAPIWSELHAFRTELVTDGLETPWSVAPLPDGRLLVTEKEGRLRLIEHGMLLPDPVAGIPVAWHTGQGGLLDVAVHPHWSENGWVYLTYSSSHDGKVGSLAVARGRIRHGAWVDSEVIFQSPDRQARPGGAQFGSRIAFDSAGLLYVSAGDRDYPEDAQDLSRPNGKIHRIFDDGRVPSDNPFSDRAGALPTIWSFGHRNPQGIVFHPAGGRLWSVEHGPRGGDELNLIESGHNYGWPLVSFGTHYDGSPVSDRSEAPGLTSPVHHWTPSIGVCAVVVYSGTAFPAWRDHLLVTSLVGETLRRLEIADGRVTHEEVLLRVRGRVRHAAIGVDGFVYVVLNSPDQLIRLVPAEMSTDSFAGHADAAVRHPGS